ncbi:CPBP family intramembrane glutamic endopeptidase [Dysgonomonas sp. Marseille-P4361]|uniref:CPBP family intramembrane glutamic endopeptidase n=1 Tax=Dysgonomonas sp. Marseille-P4361 TaxID=2161820 RepID=UPI000D554741|nr:CPBP family intramembrane glutamic endopeptidase [Dysgonomonas sp. Marseille-P4361]
MLKRDLLYGMGGWSQLFFFLFLFSSSYILAFLLIFSFVDIELMQSSSTEMRMAMVIQSICLFLVPSLAFVALCERSSQSYLIPNKEKNIYFLLLAVLLIIVIQPLVGSIGYYNQQMTLPESMSSIERWMKQSESSAEESLKLLLGDKTVLSLLLNVLVLGVVAGITEEIFFRGCLQQIIGKIVSNKHFMVWITAFIFSTIHFQFYGFFPRLLLGALLGYLFVWSGNILIPIVVHVLHNAMTVIFTYLYIDTATYETINNLNFENNSLVILVSLSLTILILVLLHKKRCTKITL